MNNLTIAFIGLSFGAAATGAVILGQDLVDSQRSPRENIYPARPLGNDLVIFIDPVTRCEYIRADRSTSALTPRMAADGIHQSGCGAPRQQSLAEIERELTRQGR